MLIHYFKCALAFFFLFFLHGTSIGNGQQGISYNVMQICEVAFVGWLWRGKAILQMCCYVSVIFLNFFLGGIFYV